MEILDPVVVDAIVVAYKNGYELVEAITSFKDWGHAGKVIIVDNDPDGTDILEHPALTGCTIMRNVRNIGFGAAQNQGVSLSHSEYFIPLNPDATLEGPSLTKGLDYMVDHPDVAMVEGPILRGSHKSEERWQGNRPGWRELLSRLINAKGLLGEDRLRHLAKLVGAGYYDSRSINSPTKVEYLAAVAPLVRRSAFDAVKGFDPYIFLYADDVDVTYRLCEQGWDLVALPYAWANHIGSHSAKNIPREVQRTWWESHLRYTKINNRGLEKYASLIICWLALLTTNKADSLKRQ